MSYIDLRKYAKQHRSLLDGSMLDPLDDVAFLKRFDKAYQTCVDHRPALAMLVDPKSLALLQNVELVDVDVSDKDVKRYVRHSRVRIILDAGENVDPEPVTPEELAAAKKDAALRINLEVRKFIYEHYDEVQQNTLQALWTEAIMRGLTNRVLYIGGALGWVKAGINSYYPLRNAIMAATSLEEIEAVRFDPSVIPNDPRVDVEVAIQMED